MVLFRHTACPPFVDRGQVQGSGDVHQHAHGEELPDRLEGQAGQPLHQVPELLVSGPRRNPDLRVIAGRVRLHLQQQQRAVLEQFVVGPAHRVERFLTDRIPGSCGERVLHAAEAPLDQRKEQRLLGREQAEQIGLADASDAGDVLGGGARQAPDGELAERRLEHLLATLLCAHPHPACLPHTLKVVSHH